MEDQGELNESLITDIIELLKDKKTEVKKGTLMMLLQFTTTAVNCKYFAETELMRLLLK